MLLVSQGTDKRGIFNICNLYIVIWLLYNFHWNDVGMYVPILDGLSTVFLAANLLVSFYCAYVVYSRYPLNSFFTTINVLVVLFVIYGTFSVIEGNTIVNEANGAVVASGSYMIGPLRTFMPIYAFFLFTELDYLNEKTIRFWFWVFLIQSIIINMMMKFSFEAEDLRTNNTGYLFVSLFPLVYFYRKKTLLQALIVIVFLIFVITSVKRGAILCLSFGVLYLVWELLRNSSSSQRLLVIFLCFVVFLIGSVFIDDLFETSEMFQRRYQDTLEGKTSGRDEILYSLFAIYIDSGPICHIFGLGADATLRYGNWAHNDWMEILFDQGLIGMICFAAFWGNWFREWRSQKKKNRDVALLIGLLFVCGFPRSTFAMWYSMANVFITLPLGYAISHVYGVNQFENNN